MAVVKNSEDGKSNENMTNNGGRSFIKNLPAILAVGLLAALDQLAKFIVTGNFELHESRPLIKGVFSLTYIRNEGIAWGMFQGGRIVFLVITVIVLAACFYVYYKISGEKKLAPVRYCLIFVFNVADIYVTVSMILLIILICFVYKDEDFEVLFKKAQ
jgi:signal peptidase II